MFNQEVAKLKTTQDGEFILKLAEYFYYQSDCDLNDNQGLLEAALLGNFSKEKFEKFSPRAVELAKLLEKEDKEKEQIKLKDATCLQITELVSESTNKRQYVTYEVRGGFFSPEGEPSKIRVWRKTWIETKSEHGFIPTETEYETYWTNIEKLAEFFKLLTNVLKLEKKEFYKAIGKFTSVKGE